MSHIDNLLLWEKYRPKKLDDTILPHRIKKLFENGVTKNYIFYGSYGTGKTSLARILIGKYSKDKAFLEINSSLYTSIEILRNDIEKFCKTRPIIETDDPIKYVFLDEFDRVSSLYQDAMKAFIEQYHKNVRFILTTNHIGKISDGIKSRFTLVNFDPESHEEEKGLKIDIFKKISNQICPDENISIENHLLKDLINSKFPDIRAIIQELQNLKETGNISNTSEISSNGKLKNELFSFILNGDNNYESTYDFLISNFGPEKIHIMLSLLGRPFVEYCIKNGINVEKLFKLNYILTDNCFKLEAQTTDPIILGMTVIGKFKEILR